MYFFSRSSAAAFAAFFSSLVIAFFLARSASTCATIASKLHRPSAAMRCPGMQRSSTAVQSAKKFFWNTGAWKHGRCFMEAYSMATSSASGASTMGLPSYISGTRHGTYSGGKSTP